ncbi:MAG: DoxX family protein [Verrucomicrobiota bacterium]
MEYHSDSSSSPAGAIFNDLGLLILRLSAGLPLLYFQGWHQSFRAWAFVWEKKSWSLMEQFKELGFAAPGFFATAVILLCVVLSLAVIFAVYTRISAFLLLVLITFMLVVPVEISGSLNAQTLLLYAGMACALIFTGAGRISLDHLLTRKKPL